MDNPEQYLLQVLRRTQSGLQDSLLPYHGTKLEHLAGRLEQAANLKEELDRLRSVSGFTKTALSMEWVMERVTRSGEDFSPDQFDADATLLSDKLFEAFLSEPFEAPAEPSVRPGEAEAASSGSLQERISKYQPPLLQRRGLLNFHPKFRLSLSQIPNLRFRRRPRLRSHQRLPTF